jgi:hypothetical protein
VGGVRLSAAGSPASSGTEPPDRPDPEEAPRPRSRLFFRIRVAILLTVLAGIVMYAWADVRSRAARNEWSRTLDVAIVVVATGAEGSHPDGIEDDLRARAEVLETRLDAELHRYREGSPPFSFEVFTVHAPGTAPPSLPADDGIVGAARYTWDLHRFTGSLDERAGIAGRRFDSRIYLLASPVVNERRKTVEGLSQEGGRVGLVEVELDRSMIDFAMFVVAHELFHTLGAPDLYDPAGNPVVPAGLADPDRVPLYPQDGAELMARHRAVGEARSVPPESIDELVVGAATARSIGWLR